MVALLRSLHLFPAEWEKHKEELASFTMSIRTMAKAEADSG